MMPDLGHLADDQVVGRRVGRPGLTKYRNPPPTNRFFDHTSSIAC